MLSFLESGWFWMLLASLLIFLAGCMLMPKLQPTPEITTPSPLPQFTVVPFASETFTMHLQIPTATVEYFPITRTTQRQLGADSDDDIYISSPNCFSSPSGGYSCLGRVWNNSENSIGTALLNLDFLNNSGQILHQEAITIEQALIPSGHFAPYRTIVDYYEPFETSAASFDRALAVPSQLRSLNIVDSRGQMNATGRYRLTATVLNDLEQRVYHLRLFASLVDSENQMIAYRIYEVGESLESGGRQSIEVELIPQAIPEQISHYIFLEASIHGD